eukprot:479966_1
MEYFARGFGPKPYCNLLYESCRKLRKTPKDLKAGAIQAGKYKGQQVSHSTEWNAIFENNPFFPKVAEYKALPEGKKWLDHFGEHLRNEMNNYRTIVVGGHGDWFHDFMQEYVRGTDNSAIEMKKTYGAYSVFKNKHLNNGDVAHITVKKYGLQKKSVQICSIDLYEKQKGYTKWVQGSFQTCKPSNGVAKGEQAYYNMYDYNDNDQNDDVFIDLVDMIYHEAEKDLLRAENEFEMAEELVQKHEALDMS